MMRASVSQVPFLRNDVLVPDDSGEQHAVLSEREILEERRRQYLKVQLSLNKISSLHASESLRESKDILRSIPSHLLSN